MMDATKRMAWVGAAALIVGLGLGMWLTGGGGEHGHAGQKREGTEERAEVWTCSMHPQIRLPGPGQCPICAMDLIPVADGAGEKLGPRQLRLSDRARALAAIRTAPVARRLVPVETRMVGKIAVDETRVSHITAWVSGRIDRLYVDYTGVRVEEGDHMAYLYSPELLTAQEELIQALRAAERLGDSGVGSIGQTARATVAASREKLRLLGLKKEQVAAIERERRASDHLTVYAPVGGVVVEKHLSQGAYVQTGTPIYTVADLSRLWLELAAYESDLPWIHYGQEVEFMAEAYPGEVFAGRVSFVDPVLDERTRTVRVRVNVANEAARLKPGMLVRAVARAEVAADGRAMDAALAGKWISPMHPEIVSDGPGACDICGMDLVRAEELGYAPVAETSEAPLVIPASAPLLTGKRAVVYVALGEGLYEGREVVLGPRAGEYYLVREGLREGEQVVVNGAFKIDSALQIRARPSMMNPQGGGPMPGHDHGDARSEPTGHEGHGHGAVDGADADHAGHAVGEAKGRGESVAVFARSLEPVFAAYFAVQQALSRDGLHGAHEGAEALVLALDAVDGAELDGPARTAWTDKAGAARKGAVAVGAAGDIAAARRAFAPLSTALIDVVRSFGAGAGAAHLYHCPMAFDNQGADWLQRSARTENPYFGSAMFRCGSRRESFGAGTE